MQLAAPLLKMLTVNDCKERVCGHGGHVQVCKLGGVQLPLWHITGHMPWRRWHTFTLKHGLSLPNTLCLDLSPGLLVVHVWQLRHMSSLDAALE